MSLSKPATEAEAIGSATEDEAFDLRVKRKVEGRIRTETNRLKRKYEAETDRGNESKVLMDQILQLCPMNPDNSIFYMRVQISTGAQMTLTLFRPTRNHGNVSDYTFRLPGVCDYQDYQEYFQEFGMWHVHVGDGTDGYNLLVTFDHKGVHIRIPSEGLTYSGDLRISALRHSTVWSALTHADDVADDASECSFDSSVHSS